jgi:LPXTG-site transpeptidase (sortase) family protein
LGAILLLLVGLGLATWATRHRNIHPNRWWRGLSSLLFLLVALNLFSLPLVQAVEEDWQHSSSVRPEASDYELFGKRLSINRPSQTFSANNLTAATGPVIPVRLRIPALGIDTNIEALGLQSSGAMDVPSNIWNAGWLASGPKPGEAGNAVIAGHKDSVKGEAVFWSLENLSPGDKIYVSDSNGNELTFLVTELASYSLDNTPLNRVFGVSDQPQLNLITCFGDFVKEQHTYNKRLVVYTRLV